MKCGQYVSIFAYGKTNISTKETAALKGARVPISYEEFDRSRSVEAPTCQGSQEAYGLSYVAAGQPPTP